MDTIDPRDSFESTHESVIEETSEPVTPETITPETHAGSKGSLSAMIAKNDRRESDRSPFAASDSLESQKKDRMGDAPGQVSEEQQPLLPKARLPRSMNGHEYGTTETPRTSKRSPKTFLGKVTGFVDDFGAHTVSMVNSLRSPDTWSRKNLRQQGVAGAKMLSAVFLGLLLNILDGLSYGKFRMDNANLSSNA